MAEKEEKKKDEIVEPKTVTVDKDAFEALLKRVENVENKSASAPQLYPLKPTKPEFFHKKENATGEKQVYSPEDINYFQKMSYYEGYPKIGAGRVETTGKIYELDDTYKPMLKGNAPVCMCGTIKDLDSLKQHSALFVPHRGVWICECSKCEQQYARRFGGFERLVSRHLFARDVPLYGMMLPDVNDPCTRRGIEYDTRRNEYNF